MISLRPIISVVSAGVVNWNALQGLAPIIVAVGGGVISLAVKAWLNHHRRLKALEQRKVRHSRTLYGDEGDPQQTGIAQDVRAIEKRVEVLEEDVREIRQIVKRIDERVD